MTLHQIKVNALYESLTKHRGDKHLVAKELDVSIRLIRYWVYNEAKLRKFYVKPSKKG
jgi:transcriptional regulator with PAS, ATPase and Fis domain